MKFRKKPVVVDAVQFDRQVQCTGMGSELEAKLKTKVIRYREALKQIANCASNHPDDVVSIARKTLREENEEI